MESDVLEDNELSILSEKRLPQPIDIALCDYCDPHDLIATVEEQTQKLVVYRLSGQKVFEILSEDEDLRITALKWKADGNALGVGYSNGTCNVYSGEDGKLLSQNSIRTDQEREDWKLDLEPDYGGDDDDQEERSAVSCIGWTSHFSKPGLSTKISDRSQKLFSAEDWYDAADDTMENGDTVLGVDSGLSALAKSITELDVTTVLPRLSALPSSHGLRLAPEGSKFTTQASIDALFDTNKSASEGVNTLITSLSSGCTNVFLDDSVKIGSIDVHGQSSASFHASHPQCSSQVTLSGPDVNGTFLLHHIDLPLETLSGSLLQVVSLNTKRIQDLIAYITQTVRCIQHDFTSNLQLPQRLINSISGELSENEEDDLVTSLYHLAMIGTFTPTILDWLTDRIKEQNHKRWDDHVNKMYSNIYNHLFVHLVPALDRLIIAATALRGYARVYEGTGKFISPDLFTAIIDDVDSVRLLAQKLQIIVMTEHRQFRAFSKWLRVMIEIGIAGPGTKGAIETEEREVPDLHYNLLLAYIKETLLRSKLVDHLKRSPDMKGSCSMSDFFTHAAIAVRRRENVVKALEEPQEEHSLADLLDLPALTVRLAGQARRTIASITKWESQMLSDPSVTPLNAGGDLEANATVLDLRLFPPTGEENAVGSVAHLLLTTPPDRKSNFFDLFRFLPSRSTKVGITRKRYTVRDGEILHAKMIDDQSCLVLYKEEGRHFILICNLHAQERLQSRWFSVLHVFRGESGFEPGCFIVGGRKGKMVCLVFGAHGQAWQALDLKVQRDSAFGKPSIDDMQL